MSVNYIKRSPLKAAQDDLARMQAEILRLEEEMEKVEAFIEMYGRYAEPAEPMSEPVERGHAVPTKEPLNVKIGNFMERYLSNADGPVPMATIFPVLEAKDLVPGAKEPKQAVSAILGKDSRFKYILGEGWTLVRRPSPLQAIENLTNKIE